ncbi:MAG: TolC family protein [Myxococcales bacterium]|nr:TolC family protein [Myxococcales bacterium]
MQRPTICNSFWWLLAVSVLASVPAAAQDSRAGAEPVVGHPVTLAEALAYADLHAPEILAAGQGQADVDAAEALAEPRTLEDPQLSVGLGPAGGGDGFGLGGSVSLTQTLEVHGERALRRDVAERWAAEFEHMESAVRWSVHSAVHGRFIEALAEQQRWEVSTTLVSFSSSVRDVVLSRVQLGEDSDLELALAENALAVAGQQEFAARADYLRSLQELAVAVGWTESTPPVPVGEAGVPQPAPDVDALLATARTERQDLELYNRRLERLDAALALAQQESRADPAIGAEYEFGVLGGLGEHRALLGLEIAITTEARRRSLEAGAVADLERVGYEMDSALAAIDVGVRAACERLDAAYAQLSLYESTLIPNWNVNLELLRRAFELGEIDLLSLMLAEERLMQQQMGAIEATRDYYVALAALEMAVGAEVMQ